MVKVGECYLATVVDSEKKHFWQSSPTPLFAVSPDIYQAKIFRDKSHAVGAAKGCHGTVIAPTGGLQPIKEEEEKDGNI